LYSDSKANAYIGTALSDWGRVFCSKLPMTATTTKKPGHEVVAVATMAKLGEKGYSWQEVLCLLAIVAVCGCCVIHQHRKKKSSRGGSDSSEDSDGSNNEKHFAGGGDGESGAKLPDAELDTLLADAVDEEEERAMKSLPAPPLSSYQELNAKYCQEASEEVDRILRTHDPHSILGSGTTADRKNAFRRLVRLLHPDKRFVSGERANLALRRVVEAHTALDVP